MSAASVAQLPPSTAPSPGVGRSHSGIAADELADLVRSFTEVTERLQSTHTALQAQVGQLQAELAEANEQLRRSRELAALGEMAAGIAHELRNPLGSIALDIELLRDDPPAVESLPDIVDAGADAGAERARICERVLRAVERLDHIVGDVLRFARDLRPQPIECDTGEVVEMALAACDAVLRRGEIAVERYGQPECTLVADRGLLVQAITNLVRNAAEALIEHRVANPTVRIGITRSRRVSSDGRRAEHVLFTIEDNGPGIPEELVERIFHPFFTTRSEGTGLGLAIVHRIVDAHGGSIQVRNGSRGAGRKALSAAAIAGGTNAEQAGDPKGELCGARFDCAIPARAGARMQLRLEKELGRGDGLNEAVRRRIGPLAR